MLGKTDNVTFKTFGVGNGYKRDVCFSTIFRYITDFKDFLISKLPHEIVISHNTIKSIQGLNLDIQLYKDIIEEINEEIGGIVKIRKGIYKYWEKEIPCYYILTDITKIKSKTPRSLYKLLLTLLRSPYYISHWNVVTEAYRIYKRNQHEENRYNTQYTLLQNIYLLAQYRLNVEYPNHWIFPSGVEYYKYDNLGYRLFNINSYYADYPEQWKAIFKCPEVTKKQFNDFIKTNRII